MRIGVDHLYANTQAIQNGIGIYSNHHLLQLRQQRDVEIVYFDGNREAMTRNEYRNALSRFLVDNQIDVYHIPSPMQIVYPDVFCTDELPPVMLSATVYDIIPIHYEEVYLPRLTDKIHYRNLLDMLRNFDILLAISEHTRQDFIRIGFSPDSIFTIWAGRDDGFCKLSDFPVDKLAHILPREAPYLLAFSANDFRKNAERIVRAFCQSIKDEATPGQLIFVNETSDSVQEALHRITGEFGVQNRLYFVGRVDKSQLCALYNGARGLVFPSLYEGFGLPALEAMQCGTPILTSNTTCMPEVVGEAGIYADPLDVDSIARGIQALLRDNRLCQILGWHGLERARMFTWERVANQTVEAFEEKVSHRRHDTVKSRPCVQRWSVELSPYQIHRQTAGAYVSFDFTTLPSGAQLESAILRIPIEKNVTNGRIYIVKEEWFTKTNRSREILVKRTALKCPDLIRSKLRYDVMHVPCLDIVLEWVCGTSRNYGLYIRKVHPKKTPSLVLTYYVASTETNA